MELNPAREGLPADPLKPGQIPDLELIVLAEPGRIIRMLLDHDAAGPGISDIEDEIDINDVFMIRPALILGYLDIGDDSLIMDQRKEIEVVLVVLPSLDIEVNFCSLADVRIAAAEAAGLIDVPYPPVNPVARLQIPFVVAGVACESEAAAVPDVRVSRYA